jgi:hypothetical protein
LILNHFERYCPPQKTQLNFIASMANIGLLPGVPDDRKTQNSIAQLLAVFSSAGDFLHVLSLSRETA